MQRKGSLGQPAEASRTNPASTERLQSPMRSFAKQTGLQLFPPPWYYTALPTLALLAIRVFTDEGKTELRMLP